MRKSLAALVLAGVLGVGAAIPGQAGAAFPGHNGKIAYVRVGNGTQDIYTLGAHGSHKRRVAANAGQPAFSPNGRKIVFTRSRHSAACQCFKGDLYTMRADGSHKRRLIHTPAAEFAPSFSPSGRKVVFASHGSGRTGIFTIRLDRTHLKKVTAGLSSDPQFSPNGNEIVFERGCEIALMRANGSDEHPLTNQVDESCDATPDFSPEGRSIVFARDKESIYVVNRDGHGLTKLAGHAGVHDDDPVFSPNGRKIAFDSDQNQPAGVNAIYTMRLDGSNVRRLTFGSRSAVEPSWGVRPS